jgi:VIT1/CCC1 family predicted Fe2+/Mn2+ transporter
VNDEDYFSYLRGDASFPGEVPVTGYAESARRPPAARHRGAGQPDHAHAGLNGTHTRPQANGHYRSEYPPNGRPTREYPYHSGPMPAYRPPAGRPAPGYPPPNGRPPRGYPGYDSGPMPAYRPSGGRPALEYPPPAGRPPLEYPPSNGRPVREHPARGGGSLLADPPSRGGPDAGHPVPRGRRILGWLPFGQRLVLLPKGVLLDDVEEELREHRDVNGGWLRPAVFGAMDGLVTNSSLIAGIGGGGGNRGAIVLSGIAGLIAGAFSMATGEYISVTSQNELTQAEVELERKQHARDPAGKQKRLTEVYMDKGVSPNLAEAVVRQISADPDRAVATHVREELGIDPDDLPSPRTAAAASFAAFTVGALIPLGPFLLGYPVLSLALVIAGVAAIVGGAAVAKLTGRSMLMGGLRQFTAAFLATGMAFAIGHLIAGHVA